MRVEHGSCGGARKGCEAEEEDGGFAHNAFDFLNEHFIGKIKSI